MLEIEEIYPKLFYRNKLFPNIYSKEKNKILIFSLSYIWIKYLSLLSTVFIKQSAQIKFVWSPYFYHDNQDQKFNQNQIDKLKNYFKYKINNFDAIELNEIIEEENATNECLEFIKNQTITDIRLIRRKVRVNIENEDKDLFNLRYEINLKTFKKMKFFLKKNYFDRVIIPAGASFEWAIVAKICKDLKIQYRTLESFFGRYDDQICTSLNETCINWDTNQISKEWENKYPHILDKKTENHFKIIRNNFNSKDDEHSMQLKTEDKNEDYLRNKYKINKNEIVCLVLPSFSYEKHYRLKRYCFKDHTDWILKTINYLIDKKVKIIFKCHPIPYDPDGDKLNFKSGDENSEYIIKKYFPNKPKNLIVIYNEDKISIESIMKISDFGVSYFSTSAQELAWQGKKSIVCANIHFAEKKFVETAKNESEYFNFIDTCLISKSNCKLSKELQNKSKVYADVWYRIKPWRIPWNILRGRYRYDIFPHSKILKLDFHFSLYARNFEKLFKNEKDCTNDYEKLINFLEYLKLNIKNKKYKRVFYIENNFLIKYLIKNLLNNTSTLLIKNILFLIKFYLMKFFYLFKKI